MATTAVPDEQLPDWAKPKPHRETAHKVGIVVVNFIFLSLGPFLVLDTVSLRALGHFLSPRDLSTT